MGGGYFFTAAWRARQQADRMGRYNGQINSARAPTLLYLFIYFVAHGIAAWSKDDLKIVDLSTSRFRNCEFPVTEEWKRIRTASLVIFPDRTFQTGVTPRVIFCLFLQWIMELLCFGSEVLLVCFGSCDSSPSVYVHGACEYEGLWSVVCVLQCVWGILVESRGLTWCLNTAERTSYSRL